MGQMIELANMIPSLIIWLLSIIGLMSILGTTLFLILISIMAKPEIVVEDKRIKFLIGNNDMLVCRNANCHTLGIIWTDGISYEQMIAGNNLGEMIEITNKMIELKAEQDDKQNN